MRLSYRFVTLVALSLVAAACGGKPPAETPTPMASDTTGNGARERARQDSIDAANRARAEADRLAREAADRQAAADRAARDRQSLMTDMAAMVHFDYDKAEVRSDDMASLDRKAAILNANPNVRVRISGHADDRGSDEYNLALGNRRAAAAKRYLVSKGIADGRIDIVSYGEERPLASGADENSWAQNRRDEFETVAGGDSMVAPR
ncbi:MAG: peptidoglycan-associated lipoprotein Pal [Gemmatimonadota bacterium]